MDFGTLVKRRGNQAPPDKGGWNALFTLIAIGRSPTSTRSATRIYADGKAGFDGWPTSPRIEALRRAWLDARDPAEQRRIASELQMQVWQDVPFIPMGEYWQCTALTGMIPGCFAVLYNIKRA